MSVAWRKAYYIHGRTRAQEHLRLRIGGGLVEGSRSMQAMRWLLRGLDLTFGPRPQLFDEREGRWPVESGRLLALVAELDCPR